MRRLHAAAELLAHHPQGRVTPGSPADDALLHLLGHMALRDDVFEDSEIDMLARVVPQWNATSLRAWLGQVASQPLDLSAVADTLRTDDQRWTALRYTARMALADDHLDDEERGLLEQLSEALGLPPSAVDRVVAEAKRRTQAVTADEVRDALEAAGWEAPDFVDGEVQSADLCRVLPDDLTPVTRVGVDGAEVLGLYAEGVVARFLEGVAFLPWTEIVATSQGDGLASSVRLHAEDGRYFSLVDPRMSGIVRVIRRIQRVPVTASGAHPVIERVAVPSGEG